MIIFTEHRFFLESVHRSKDDMLFALTTNVAIANEYGYVFKKGMLCFVEPEETDTAFFSKLSEKIVQNLPKQILQCMFPSDI